MMRVREVVVGAALAAGVVAARGAAAADGATVGQGSLPSPAPASKAPALDGAALLQRWLRRSPEVAAWRTRVGAARFDVLTAKVWPNLNVALAAYGLLQGASINGESGVDAQVSQPLPVFGQLEARRAAAERLVGVTEASVAAQLWERASEIHEAMVEQAFAAARVDGIQRNLDELTRLQNIVVLRAKEGASGPYDVLRASTQVAAMSAGLHNAMIDRGQAEHKLLALIADPTLTAASMTPDALPHLPKADESTLIARALERRPDLLEARREEQAQLAEAERQRKDAIPTPSVVVESLVATKPYGFQLQGGLALPIPISDRNQGAIGRALETARGRALFAHALEARIRFEVQGAYATRERARQAIEQLRGRVLPDALELVRRAEITYQAGQFSIAELFDAYGALWDVRAQEVELMRQLAEAEVGLGRAAVLLPIGATTDGR